LTGAIHQVKKRLGLPEGPEAPAKIDPSQFAVSSSESESEGESEKEQEEGARKQQTERTLAPGAEQTDATAEAMASEATRDEGATVGGDKVKTKAAASPSRSDQAAMSVFATAITRKNEGNTYFRAGMYDDAATIYSKALESLEAACDTVLSNGQKEEIAKIAGNSAGERPLQLSADDAVVLHNSLLPFAGTRPSPSPLCP